jgi:hypothetical protein
MFSFRRSLYRYQVLSRNDDGTLRLWTNRFRYVTRFIDRSILTNYSGETWRRRMLIWGEIAVLVAVTAGVVTLLMTSGELKNRVASTLGFKSNLTTTLSSSCRDPPIRQEWRQLSVSEKKKYITAVKCLQTTPSRWNSNDTLYDDFPRLHQLVGTFGE